MKTVKIGDELVLDLAEMSSESRKEVSITIVDRMGSKVRLRISADKSIPIKHFTQQRIPA